jgi:hypothetical protein
LTVRAGRGSRENTSTVVDGDGSSWCPFMRRSSPLCSSATMRDRQLERVECRTAVTAPGPARGLWRHNILEPGDTVLTSGGGFGIGRTGRQPISQASTHHPRHERAISRRSCSADPGGRRCWVVLDDRAVGALGIGARLFLPPVADGTEAGVMPVAIEQVAHAHIADRHVVTVRGKSRLSGHHSSEPDSGRSG